MRTERIIGPNPGDPGRPLPDLDVYKKVTVVILKGGVKVAQWLIEKLDRKDEAKKKW